MAEAKLLEYFNQMKKAINEIYKNEKVTEITGWIFSIVKQIGFLLNNILKILKANRLDVGKILEVLGLPTGLLATGKFSLDRIGILWICIQAVVSYYCSIGVDAEMDAASSTGQQNKIAKLISYLGSIGVEIVQNGITGVVDRGAKESSMTEAINNTSRQSLDSHNITGVVDRGAIESSMTEAITNTSRQSLDSHSIHHGGGGGRGGRGGYGPRYTQTPKPKDLCSSVEYSCFVGYLGWGTKDQALHKAFSVYGEIRHVKIINDQQSGRSKGFGFVTFSNESSMRDAIQQMNGQSLDGRNIAVKEAHSRGRGGGEYRRSGGGRDYRRSGGGVGYRGSSGGFGFVTFTNESSTKDGIQNMNDQSLDGRNVTVMEARSRGQGGGGGGRGYRYRGSGGGRYGNSRTHGGHDKDHGYRGGIYGGIGGVYGGSHRDGDDGAYGGNRGRDGYDRAGGGGYGGSYHDRNGGVYSGSGGSDGYGSTCSGPGKYGGFRITGGSGRYRGYHNADGCGYGGRRRDGSGGACGERHSGGGGGYGRRRDGNGGGFRGSRGGRRYGNAGCGGIDGGYRGGSYGGSRASDSSNWKS